MREFNTFGPVYPQIHYYLDRQEVKAEINQKIGQGRYFTLNAARQMGKTTILKEITAELTAGGEYFAIYIDFEEFVKLETADFYEQLGEYLRGWCELYEPAAPEPKPMRHHAHFINWLTALLRGLGKPGVLIVDEFEALSTDILLPLLSLLRGMYIHRAEPNRYGLQSIILVGVRTIASLLEGTQSPFNIADQYTIPYFTIDETTTLLQQHTIETGQPFAEAVLQTIFDESGGQPYLVNRLGKLLTEQIVPLPDKRKREDATLFPVLPHHLEQALATLVNEYNPHFYTITSKALPYRDELLPMLFYDQIRTNFRDPVTAELLMYGILRIETDPYGLRSARIANAIYRKVLLLTFTPALPEYQPNGTVRHRYLVDGLLNFAGLLASFQAFMIEHGVRLLKSAKTGRPLEMSGQYLLLSYLTAALNSIQGFVTIESMSAAGEMDILAFYQGERFIIETKIWYGMAKYEEGKQQLADYLQAADLERGYMVIFDEQLDDNPLFAAHGDMFDVAHENRRLQVYFIRVDVL